MPRVLIAEDDTALREALEEALSIDGFEVRVAGSADEACLEVAREPVDVVVSDIRMPGDGVNLVRRLRDVDPDLPVILMTGFDAPGVRQIALEAGARDYLVKPIALSRLLEAIDRVAGANAPR